MAVRLNLGNTVRYLSWMPLERLGGLQQAVTEKAEELGVVANRRRVPRVGPDDEITGNTAGIFRFVGSLNKASTKSEKRQLAVLLGVIEGRIGAKPKPPAPRLGRRAGRRGRGK